MISPEQLVEKLRDAKKRQKQGEKSGTQGLGERYDLIREQITQIEHELRQLKRELDRLENAYQEGDITEQQLEQRKEEIAERREELLGTTETLRSQLPRDTPEPEEEAVDTVLDDRLQQLKDELVEDITTQLKTVERGDPVETGEADTVKTVEQETPAVVEKQETRVERMEVSGDTTTTAETTTGEEPSPFDEEQLDIPQEEEGMEEDLSSIDIRYPLTPQNPAKGDIVYAWAHVTYNDQEDELQYIVDEPELTENIRDVREEVEEILKETIDVDFSTLQEEEAKTFLEDRIAEIVEEYDFGLNQEELDILEYYAKRDFIGLGKIEPLMNDPEIEDISCDGVGIPLFVYHRDPRIGSVKTNIVFHDEDRLDSFIIKLAQRCGRSVSVAEPLLDGSLPDGSRVQATLATDIARRGSNFTIRKFTEDPLTPVHMMGFGTLDADMLAYLWFLVEYGKSVLIAGPTASGKTSMLNALSLFIRPELKIVSIEDTPELRLPHPHWIPETSRSGYGFGEKKTGEVTLHDLLKESLRQRPDYIIVGEVRGQEAYVLFQQMSTGHPGMSTIHAPSVDKVMNRLTTKPIDLPANLIANIDTLLFMRSVRYKGKHIRRAANIYEIEGFDDAKNAPIVNKTFRWIPGEDEFESTGNSSQLMQIATEHGFDTDYVKQELAQRREILEWMYDQGMYDYRKIGKIVSAYYVNPDKVLSRVRSEQ